MIFWVGARVSKEVLWDLFGVEDVHGLDTSMVRRTSVGLSYAERRRRPQPRLPVLTSRLSRRVHNILGQRYGQRGHAPRMLVVRQNLDGMEIEFSDMLVEDQNNGAMSYLDCKSMPRLVRRASRVLTHTHVVAATHTHRSVSGAQADQYRGGCSVCHRCDGGISLGFGGTGSLHREALFLEDGVCVDRRGRDGVRVYIRSSRFVCGCAT